MGFLSSIFGSKDELPREENIASYADFWRWFQTREKDFAAVVKAKGNIEKHVFDVLRPKLHQLNDDIYYLVGIDNGIIELVLTVDGKFRSIADVEDLVQAAPPLAGWKFTALKPAMGSSVGIQINGYEFDKSVLHFYANDKEDYPDEIDITVVHDHYAADRAQDMGQGVYIFLDNYLGELRFVSAIDNMSITGREGATKELIPIEKLEDYIIWREKEFVEKYEGMQRSTERDNYSMMEAVLEGGKMLVATINTDVLHWDAKASHPFLMVVTIPYKGNKAGMPDEAMQELMYAIEDAVQAELKDTDGYINVGRQTADGAREIYYVCKEFRKPSKVLRAIQQKYAAQADISFDIFKDKYWQTFERYRV